MSTRIDGVINSLVDMCKGRGAGRTAYKFYYTIVSATRYTTPNTVDEVREQLQRAHWVEEEDLYQHCYTWLFEHYKKTGSQLSVSVAARYLHYSLAIYLMGPMKVFSRQRDWETKYIETLGEQTYEIPDSQLDLRILTNDNPYYNLEELSLLDRYLVYCISLGYSSHTLPKLMNDQGRTVHKILRRNLRLNLEWN